MADQKMTPQKELTGIVTSDKMMRTVVVEVTTFKVHPLYHKRYRWTKKYLSDTGETTPKVGDTVRIASTKPMSKLKRWVVAEVLTSAGAAEQLAARKATARKAQPATAKKKAK